MLLARVVGTVVASQKADKLDGLRLLIVESTDAAGQSEGALATKAVAADAIGAGLGDLVLCVTGSSARQTQMTCDRPIDAAVVAIVDTVEALDAISYHKAEDRF